MTSNKQQQEEELLILKSILGDTITVLSHENDQFEIDVEFQLHTPFHLRVVDSANQLSTPIQHLPPLILTIHFHDQYPSSIHSPTFVLSSCYLSHAYLQGMCQKLDQIWEQNSSEPIVYQWIECLKEYFLNTDELSLTDNDENISNDDPRAMSSYQPHRATHVYEQLIAYNQNREYEKFLLEYHECPICMSNNIPGRDMIRLFKCHHSFCRICLNDYAKTHITAGSVEWLLCPDSQCQLALLPSEMKTILNNDQLYEKYERLLLQKTLDQMQDIVWCPRCQQAVLTGKEGDSLALCDECRFAFCKKCKKTYHAETLCGDELKLIELREKRRRLHQQIKAFNLTPEDEDNLLREFLAGARIENSTRCCPNPSCQVPIEKNEGCDHMYCIRCNRPFLWSAAVQQTTETKVLFENDYIDIDKLKLVLEHEENMDEKTTNLKTSAVSLISKMFLKRTKKCPNSYCAKLNVKSSTGNYLICLYCKRGFCFCCGQTVNNPKGHFGHGCKRYSDL